MKKRDRYNNFAELFKVEQEHTDYTRRLITRDSDIAIIAPHGGSIEPGTSEIALAIANNTYSFYAFEGLKRSGNFVLHITSINFDEPSCIQLTKTVDTVVAVHGCEGKKEAVNIGGLDQELINKVSVYLSRSGFNVSIESKEYPGIHIQNICNRGRSGKGLQIEITEGLRKIMFMGLKRHERNITTSIFSVFVSAIKEALLL